MGYFWWAPNVTCSEKNIGTCPGFESRASPILSLHSTTDLPNHMSTGLMIYHQRTEPGYITPSKLEFSREFWTQRDIVKCSQGAEAVTNHIVGCPHWVPNVTGPGGEKISDSTGIGSQGLRNIVPALYH